MKNRKVYQVRAYNEYMEVWYVLRLFKAEEKAREWAETKAFQFGGRLNITSNFDDTIIEIRELPSPRSLGWKTSGI